MTNNYAIGVDVSSHQGSILDWQRIADSGISFVYLRHSVGVSKDTTFDLNLKGAKEAGLRIGAYHYVWANASVSDQVKAFTQAPLASLDLPLALDIEQYDILEANVKLFLLELKRLTGTRPIIYTRQNVFDAILGISGRAWLKEYDFWLAEYPAVVGDYPTRLPSGTASWRFWQWSSTGSVPNHAGNIDMNFFNGSVEDLCCYNSLSEIELRWPVNSPVVTQAFGANPDHYSSLLGAPFMGHEGVDFRANLNDPIYACADGIVSEKYFDEAYGNLVVLDHQNGYKTLYAHLSKPSSLSLGTRVKAGDRIGDAGTTGASTGTHLHLNLYHENAERISVYPKKSRGYLLNPTPYLKYTTPVETEQYARNISGLVLNIRKEASAASEDIGDIPVDAIVQIYPPAVNEYIKITYAGITGYALSKHFELGVSIKPISTMTSVLNIRSGPGTTYTDVGDIHPFEILTGWPSNAEWWRVRTKQGVEGYSLAQWLEKV